MSVQHFRRLVKHSHWGLDQVVAALQQAPERLDEAVLAGTRTPRGTLRHMFAFERGFLARIEGRDASNDPLPESVEELTAAWTAVRAGWLGLLDRLNDADLDVPIGIRLGSELHRTTRGDVLSQFVQHQGQHRSELAVMASTFGHSPGELDWWDFLEQGQAG